MQHTLEKSPWFPYIAWAVVIGFSVFTFLLTKTVEEETSVVLNNRIQLESALQTYGKPAATEDAVVR